jgi:hypothetical protein
MDKEQLRIFAQLGKFFADYAREMQGQTDIDDADYRPMNDNRARHNAE